MMHMTFYWSREVTLLVNSWRTKTWLSYSLSLLVCLVVSAVYQYLENRRMRLKVITTTGGSSTTCASPETSEEPLLQPKKSAKKWSAARICGALLFGVNSAIGYLLMLAVMSFNGGVFLAIVLGLAIGYLMFRSEDENLTLGDSPCACA
ncbi:hypothetical protein JCGZ_07585 [Jatropha curcas]|uniref:Copper transport protein n=1 Tax=Jatropha curcas TaxID=180498 RepID=A0A067KQB2_JATCU|nr:copper transporter 5.1 [Jatropha curcas]KDP34014.1 hypothetical protein JCGZ_07585 [Jatropha curcas]